MRIPSKTPSIYRFAQVILDAAWAFLACYIAFLVRFEGQIEPGYQTLAWVLPLVAIPGRFTTQLFFGLYQQIWRLFGLNDFIRLLNAVSFYSLLVLVVTRLMLPRLGGSSLGIPLGVAVIDWSFCLMGMVVIRYARRRLVRQPLWGIRKKTQLCRRVLVIGAGQAGVMLVQEILQTPDLAINVVGFIDDDRTKVSRRVEGVRVLGTTEQLLAIAQTQQVEDVLIAMPSAPTSEIRRIVDQLHNTPFQLKILPGQTELLRDRSLTPQVRPLQIQDILGRPEIHLDFAAEFATQFPAASEQVYQKTVLVTGAGGTIGSEICRQLARLKPQRLLLLGRGENSIFNIQQELMRTFPHLETQALIADIRHTKRIEQLLQTWQPHLLFHAAAHKHVPLMEHNPTEALENNTLASATLAQLAAQAGVQAFVMISTDKAVDPANFMGLSKRLAELLVRPLAAQSKTRFLTVRFGNVLGSRGSVVPIFQAQIERGGPVTVTDAAMTRYFMTTPEAAQLVVQSLAVGKSGQILILDMGEPVRIYDLAEQMIYLAGYQPGVDIPIQIMGLRPGEKLHEALFSSNEQSSATAHPKIRAVDSQLPSRDRYEQVLGALREAVREARSTQELWQLAQEYQGQLEANAMVNDE
ncbi:MAG: polysaccharide biosynthesis protein [Spirulina sp. SIO3F2]|nr:polysaccharide biosynthesis protein [Spirulina sp. SIO3F2]